MESARTKFCPAVWLSGFFALGALVHLVRSVFGFTLAVAGHEVSMTVSVLLFAALGTLSAAALFIGLKQPCSERKTGTKVDCCKHTA